MSLLKIKRSGVSGSPPTLAQAELAYSYLAGTQSNGGDRLYIGTGSEIDGSASNIEVIGGKYFTDRLDHSAGTVVPNKAIVIGPDGKIDHLSVDNITIDGNTISSTNTNGAINLNPNGTGVINASGARLTGLATPTGSTDAVSLGYLQNTYASTMLFTGDSGSDGISSGETLSFVGGAGILTAASNNTLTVSLSDSGVTAGSYGSSTQIPIITVDVKGNITSASQASVATSLQLTGDTGSDSINLISDTLDFDGGLGVTSSVTANRVTYSIGQNVAPSSNVQFADGDFSGDLTVDGNLYVNGDTVSVDVANMSVEDPLIRLASGNTADTVDIGFIGSYNDGVDQQHAGIFRNASDGEFYVFETYVDTNVNDNNINTNDPTYGLATVNADIFKFSDVSLSLSGDVTGTVTIQELGSGNINISTTIAPNSVALGTDTTGSYVRSIVPGTGMSVSGTNDITVSGVNATTTGTKGVASYNPSNFGVTSGLVSISSVDGGTY